MLKQVELVVLHWLRRRLTLLFLRRSFAYLGRLLQNQVKLLLIPLLDLSFNDHLLLRLNSDFLNVRRGRPLAENNHCLA